MPFTLQAKLTETHPELGRLFDKYPQVGIVYFYGSRAAGKGGPASDYDFAVYFDEADVVKRSDLRFTLIGEISKILGTDAVDIQCLNDLQLPELKYRIIFDGKVIFEREPYRVIIEPRILNEYFDFVYLLRKYGLTKIM